MRLEQFHKSNCQEFIYRKINRESSSYGEPVVVSRQEVINVICKKALIASQYETIDPDRDINILSVINNTLREYSEYELTEETINRLNELTGFKQTKWTDLLKI